MSHSLHLRGCPYPLRYTSTEFTWKWLGKDRFEILEAYKAEYIDTRHPKPLHGKDARNPYLQQKWQEEVEELQEEYERLKEWLHRNPQVQWEND